VARGLRVEELSGDEVTAAQTVRAAHQKLSLPDAFAYALASVRGWTLLTGDGEHERSRKPKGFHSSACYGCLTNFLMAT
jgi:predicted nucleic acid-binding protein